MMKGKVALVTGGGSGIGRATAMLFAVHGAAVVVADKNLDGANKTLEMIKKSGEDGVAMQVDVSEESQIKKMVDDTIKKLGRLDFACNNAGIEGETNPITECSNENWQRVLDINLRGVLWCMKYEIPEMLKNGGGALVNISSIAGLVGFSGMPAYVSSKHAINGLTKTAALENAQQGLRVNSVCPGAIQTPMIERFVGESPEARKDLETQHPMGRFGKPEEVAEAVVWLCSDKASYVTGQTLAVDGGFTSK